MFCTFLSRFSEESKRAQEWGRGNAVSGDLSSGHRVLELCCSVEVKRNLVGSARGLFCSLCPVQVGGTLLSGRSVRALHPLPDLLWGVGGTQSAGLETISVLATPSGSSYPVFNTSLIQG